MFMNKKGVAALEAIFGMMLVLIILLSAINVFIIGFSRITIERDMGVITQQAAIDGGVTSGSYDGLKMKLANSGYDTTKIVFTAMTNLGESAFIGDGLTYISKDSEDNQMVLTLNVPYKENQKFFKLFSDITTMSFSSCILSNKN